MLEQRQEIEQALAVGDVERAQAMAFQIAQNKGLGPWEKTVIGRAALIAEDFSEAEAWLAKAHNQLPDEGAILVDLASARAGLKRWPQAAQLLGEALSQRPGIADLHERHAIYLANAGDGSAAIAALKRALALDATRGGSWALLGERWLERGHTEEAEGAFRTALTHDPSNSAALWNLALLKEKAGALEAALDLLNQVPADTAETAQARHRRGQMLLSLGQLEEGWAEYAARLRNRSYVSWQYALRVPYWSGEDLAGKHMVVWADQGLGEQILTASLLPDVATYCGRLTFACDPRLVPLLGRSFPGIQVVPLTLLKDGGPDLGPIDAQATLSELGAVLRPSHDAFPTAHAFLKPDPSRVSGFRQHLRAGDGPLIGISWRSENTLAGHEKSTNLADHWKSLLEIPSVRFVSLQYGDTECEIAQASDCFGVDIITVPDLNPMQDVDGFAALVAAMDTAISTSNTTVHVAGGLGIEAYAILPQAYGRPWYWFDKGETSPWYQNLTLLRSQGNWGVVAAEAADKLVKRLGNQA